MKAIIAQTKLELVLTLRRGESVLLTFAIPVLLLGFFSEVKVLPTGPGKSVAFLVPGILALAVMSTAMVSLAIATGFERSMGVLKRLGATPLTRPQLLAAKTISILVIEALQVIVLLGEGLLLGWHLAGGNLLLALAAMGLASIGFAGLGMLMAGTMPALTTLAAANGVYFVLLLLGGMVVPLSKLPSGLAAVAKVLPAGALSQATHGALGSGGHVPSSAWLVLLGWAVVAPALGAWRFRWE
jgi:ABC-2 type transport system permease protein